MRAASECYLIAARVGLIREVVCASPAYLKSRGTPKPADLASHECITYEGYYTTRNNWEFHTKGSSHTILVSSRLVVNSAEAAVIAANKGPSRRCPGGQRFGRAKVVREGIEPSNSVLSSRGVRVTVRHEFPNQHISRVQSKPRPVTHYHTSAVRQQAAALPLLDHSEARTRQSCEPTQIERTLPTIAPRAS
jgi:DNA-binding transcriptional LysR family regulator